MKESEGSRFSVHTDLALEEHESFPGDGGEIAGIKVREWEKKENGIRITEVVIKDAQGAERMQKPVGTYLTVEAPALAEDDEDYRKEASDILAEQIRRIFKRHGIRTGSASILAVGLGNRDATPDSLGPLVMDRLPVTRHLNLEYGSDFCEKRKYPVLSGITPGVMAQTGMETAEIIQGIVSETAPDAVLVIDSLAARSVRRLGVTFQLSDTGIHPGSGVGNHRGSLTEKELGVPVFAVGVPTVVGAAAIVHDTVDAMIGTLKREKETAGYGDFIGAMNPEEQYELIRELLEPQFGPMYVTPHNIDERVESLCGILSEAIRTALFGGPERSGGNRGGTVQKTARPA